MLFKTCFCRQAWVQFLTSSKLVILNEHRSLTATLTAILHKINMWPVHSGTLLALLAYLYTYSSVFSDTRLFTTTLLRTLCSPRQKAVPVRPGPTVPAASVPIKEVA